MTHEEALNLLLANACPAHEHGEEIREFTFDLHCVEAVIKARLVNTVDNIQYEIISVELT